MEKYFSVGEAAKAVHITAETLRHYDRIGLIHPSKKDVWTNYRYYTEQDILRINTIRALQQMDLPLQNIKEVLEYDDLEKIIGFLAAAEKKADEKMASLVNSKAKIQAAKATYENKLRGQQHTGQTRIKRFPKRVILLSDTLADPTLDNLWNYLRHFYGLAEGAQKEQFEFEDTAGIYTENGVSRLFAVCLRHGELPGLKLLPAGNYLCADCTEENRVEKALALLQIARQEHHAQPQFTIQEIIVSGILQWNYRAQVYLGE